MMLLRHIYLSFSSPIKTKETAKCFMGHSILCVFCRHIGLPIPLQIIENGRFCMHLAPSPLGLQVQIPGWLPTLLRPKPQATPRIPDSFTLHSHFGFPGFPFFGVIGGVLVSPSVLARRLLP